MNNQEILEYNRKCAEFMGWEINTFKEQYLYIVSPETATQYNSLEELKFHSDWNWIMDVIEKMEKNFKKYYIRTNIWNKTCNISAENSKYIEVFDISKRSPTKKESTIEAITQFLTWYNANK